jgi:YidC/Oxa1 family membrane protein insertase
MHSTVFQLFPGRRPGRKRCPLPEILNPNFHSENSADRNKQSILVVTVLGLIVLCIHLYLVNSTPGTPKQIPQAQPQPKQKSDAPGVAVRDSRGHSFAHLRAVSSQASIPAPAAKNNATGQPLEPPIQFGWLTFLAKPLYLALRFLYGHGIGNWGWAIIILTLIFNLVMFWPRMLSMKSSLRTMRLQPKVETIKRRYAHLKINDPKRAAMNTELMALYKDGGASMYGGCLPMLLQMPLFFAYFRVLQNAAELRQARWFWLTDLSAPDPLHILPILIILTMCLTQFITPSPGMDPAQRRLFAFVMPAIMGFTLWRYASGLALYWATGNLINLVVQLGINRTSMGREMHALAAKRADTNTNERE